MYEWVTEVFVEQLALPGCDKNPIFPPNLFGCHPQYPILLPWLSIYPQFGFFSFSSILSFSFRPLPRFCKFLLLYLTLFLSRNEISNAISRLWFIKPSSSPSVPNILSPAFLRCWSLRLDPQYCCWLFCPVHCTAFRKHFSLRSVFHFLSQHQAPIAWI